MNSRDVIAEKQVKDLPPTQILGRNYDTLHKRVPFYFAPFWTSCIKRLACFFGAGYSALLLFLGLLDGNTPIGDNWYDNPLVRRIFFLAVLIICCFGLPRKIKRF